MFDPAVVLFHARLQQSPPLGTRLAIALLGGLAATAIVAPIVSYRWGRLEPVEAIEDVVLRIPMSRVPTARIAVLVGLGMLVGLVFEALAAAGERIVGDPTVLVSELTLVDAIAGIVVMAGVFAAGLLAVHIVRTGDPDDPTIAAVYRRWLLVSVGFVGVCIWAILVIHDLLWLAGVI